jgi:hypothetical protein
MKNKKYTRANKWKYGMVGEMSHDIHNPCIHSPSRIITLKIVGLEMINTPSKIIYISRNLLNNSYYNESYKIK